MTWTYDQPVAGSGFVPVSQVRFLLRDTAETEHSLSDEEIDWLIGQWQAANPGVTPVDFYTVAGWAAWSVADSYSGMATGMKRVGDTQMIHTYKEEVERWLAFSRRLLARSPYFRMAGMGLIHGAAAIMPVFAMRMMDYATGGDAIPSEPLTDINHA